MATGFAVTALVSMALNMTLPEELEDNEAVDPEESENSFHSGASIGGKAGPSEEKRMA